MRGDGVVDSSLVSAADRHPHTFCRERALAEANPSPAVAPATAAVRPAMPRSTASDSTLAMMPIDSVDDVRAGLAEHDYLADEGLATSIFLALRLHRPLLLEGEAGVGKTEVAKVLAAWTGGELVRLQCYEGIDASQAVYEWDYARQLLHLRAVEASGIARRRRSRTSCTPNDSS